MHDVRKIIRNITPNKWERCGLIKSIEEFRNLIQKNNIEFDFRHEVSENDLNEKARLNIYRIIMELINNSIKHSHCKIIQLLFKTYSEKTMICYLDDGCGKWSIENMHSGMGLKSMKARVEALGGKIDFINNFQNDVFCQILLDNKILFKY
jgi:signal transduction histidine kinase